jgi:predicted PurR-regulated permease PerM
MDDEFKRRATFSLAVCVGLVVAITLVWMTRVILLLLFAGLIGALLLSIVTNWTQQKLRLRRSLALIAVVAFFAICLGLGIWMRGPALADQISNLQVDLPAAAHKVLISLQEQGWGRWLLSHFADRAQLSDGFAIALTRIGGIVITTASTFVGLFVVVAASLYVAAEPSTYLRGLHRITPLACRQKLDLCLASATQMLRSWLVAKAISMVFIGALISVGLWALHVPLAGTLGIIAGLLTFIPNLGPVISFLPAALLAFAISPMKGILTILLFCLAHILEGTVITPLLERQIVTLPPALTLAVQLLLASVSGAIGVALAAPLTAAALGILHVLLPPESPQFDPIPHKDESDHLGDEM